MPLSCAAPSDLKSVLRPYVVRRYSYCHRVYLAPGLSFSSATLRTTFRTTPRNISLQGLPPRLPPRLPPGLPTGLPLSLLLSLPSCQHFLLGLARFRTTQDYLHFSTSSKTTTPCYPLYALPPGLPPALPPTTVPPGGGGNRLSPGTWGAMSLTTVLLHSLALSQLHCSQLFSSHPHCTPVVWS